MELPRIVTTTKGNMRFAFCGELCLTVLGPTQWSTDEFAEYLRLSTEASLANLKVRAVASYLNGPTHTPAERKMAAETHKKTDVMRRLAVITDQKFVHAMITALGWLIPGPKMKAFATDDASMFAWCAEVAEFDRLAAEMTLERMLMMSGYKAMFKAAGT